MGIRFAIVAFDLLLLYFIFGHSALRRVMPRRMRVRAELKDAAGAIRHFLNGNVDRLPAAKITKLEEEITAIHKVRAEGDAKAAATALESVHNRWESLVPPVPHAGLREFVEVVVVAFVLAFSVRSFFLQPFKIPTGSMQPTLFGIHFIQAGPDTPVPSAVSRVFDFVHYSRRYVNVRVQEAGVVEGMRGVKPSVPFFPCTDVSIGGVTYRLPGAPENVRAYLESSYRLHYPDRKVLFFEKGDILAQGWLELGDHLFVDRTRLNFCEPQRGDITVFLTDGLVDPDGSGFGGRWYIKRLVGLPGDELQIRDHKLYVKTPGSGGFTPVDESVSPAFRRLYSFTGGYHGYCHFPNSQYLRTPDATFKLGPDEFFMLGDNSESSKDSRFWGVVPRQNLVGRANFTWWPFSRRWGFTDVAEPENFASPPTMN